MVVVDQTKLHTGVFATPLKEKDTTEETVKYNPPRPFVYVPKDFDLYRTYTICPSPRNVGNSFHAVRRGTNFIRFVYTTNANGKIFGDFYVSFFDIFFISWSKRGDGFYV